MQIAALVILLPDYEYLEVRDADSLVNGATLPVEYISCTHAIVLLDVRLTGVISI